MRILLLIALLIGLCAPALAQDVTTTYSSQAFKYDRIPGVVMLCPSSDGSKTAIPCPSSSGGLGSVSVSNFPENTPLTYTHSTSYTVGTTSSTLFAASTYARVVQICTTVSSAANIWLNMTGGTAVAGQGVPVWGGGRCTNIGTLALPMPSSAVTAITDGTSSQTVAAAGG